MSDEGLSVPPSAPVSAPVTPTAKKLAEKKAESPAAPEIVAPPSRPKAAFVISVLQARNLVAAKGEAAPVNSSARIQFLAEPSADSELFKDNKQPAYNLIKAYEREFSEALANEVINTPLRVTVLEGTGKSQAALGTATIELEPLFDAGKISGWFPLAAPNGQSAAEVQVEVSTGEPLHQADQSSATARHNIVVMRAEYVSNVPPKWASAPKGEQRNNVFAYTLSAKLPASVATADLTELRLAAGALSLYTPPPVEGQAKPDDPQWRVTWPAPLKRYVSKETMERWLPLLEKADPSAVALPVEFCRVLTKEYESLEDKNAGKYRGGFTLDVSSLGVPGTQVVSGTYDLANIAAKPAELEAAKPGGDRRGSLLAGGAGGLPPKTPDKKPGTPSKEKAAEKAAANKAADSKAAAGKGKKQKEVLDAMLALEEDETDTAYELAGTQVKLELSFAKPPFVRPPTPRAVLNVADFIPKRAPFPRFYQLHEASEEFHLQIKGLAESLAVEYLKLFGDESDAPDASDRDKAERRKRFFFELNHNGQYFAFKEKLKKTVVRVVREKFHRNAFPDKNQVQSFITELYVYLIDEMHIALNDLITDRTVPSKEVKAANLFRVSDITSVDGLKRLADEAEMVGKFGLASQYYRERIVKSTWNPDLWLEYAQFSLRARDLARAEECLVEAIIQDRQHAQSLALYGAFGIQTGEYQKAEAFLREAVASDPDDFIIQALAGKLYELIEVEDNGAAYYQNAARLHKEAGAPRPLNLEVAAYALQNYLPSLAERFINRELSVNGTAEVGLLLAKVYFQTQNLQQAETVLKEFLTIDEENPDAWAQFGDLAWSRNDVDTACSAYENALRIFEQQDVIKLYILLRLGELYSKQGQHEKAKLTFIKICKLSPSAYPWLGVGRACVRLGEYQNAQDALAEANVQNQRDPRVWGWIALLCHATGRQREGELALREALRLDLNEPDLLREMGEVYLNESNPASAENCVRLALQYEDPARARTVRLLADALFASGRKEEAFQYYQQVVNWSKDDATAEDFEHANSQVGQMLFGR